MPNARPCDCSLKQYGYMALWSSCNIGILQSLKSHDSFLKRKFKHSPGRGLTVIAACVHSLLHPTCDHNHKLLASGSAEMKRRDINILRTLMSCDHQLGEKFRNLAPKSCRLGAILLYSTISFELHAEMAEIYVEKCNFHNFRNSETLTWSKVKVKVKVTEVSDLGSGQGHTSMCNTYRTTSLPDHVTLSSSRPEICPFEIREILTFRKVWTHVIAFVEGNLKIGLRDML